MSSPYYPNAPIVEAIIDLQVRYGEQLTADCFEACYTKIADKLPTKVPIQLVQMGVANLGQEEGELQVQSDRMQVGLRLESASNDRVLQLQHRGFTYSHMAPYSKWEAFRDEARYFWDAFLDTCTPTVVTRVAVRFINRVIIPEHAIELSDYFSLYPSIPKGIPQDLSGLFMQLQMPQPDLGIGAMAVINLALEAELGKLAVLLDFDVFRFAEYEPTSNDVWDCLDRLRNRKNKLFEACITDKTRGLIA